ncbi:hypothetical protein [Nonomuraea guangzhouensis]|uniref:Uncharacterized protein n=1 Tax=Nonomuraea guangzhouensis TaxID=1291555 RepID=A0ABW4GWP0_9ACTN|nr:hypothetical protein [Nonomuraea guangzhouensis]
MTATLLSRTPAEDLAAWEALSFYDRHHRIDAFWRSLDPATARARFAAAVDLLAVVNAELAAHQVALDHFREQFEGSR